MCVEVLGNHKVPIHNFKIRKSLRDSETMKKSLAGISFTKFSGQLLAEIVDNLLKMKGLSDSENESGGLEMTLPMMKRQYYDSDEEDDSYDKSDNEDTDDKEDDKESDREKDNEIEGVQDHEDHETNDDPNQNENEDVESLQDNPLQYPVVTRVQEAQEGTQEVTQNNETNKNREEDVKSLPDQHQEIQDDPTP